MAITAPSPHAPPDPPLAPLDDGAARPPGAPRPLGRRHQLPGGRAVVGGLLVTLAALAAFVASTSAGAGPSGWVVVVNRAVPVGERLTASDVRAVPADLPTEVQSTLFSAVGDLEGAVALEPLGADQAVPRDDVSLAPDPDVARTHDLSFALERDRALNGRIQPGELVDLVATFGSGADARTEVVVRRVRVAALDLPSATSAGSAAKVTITLAFPTEDEVLRAANALEVAKVTLSRSTGIAAGPPVEAVGSGEPDVGASGSTVAGPPTSTPAAVGADAEEP